MGALIRIVQLFPLLIVLGVLAGIAYLVIAGAKSPTRAKEVIIRVFLWLSVALSVFFLLASLYAALERNSNVLEFFVALLALALVMLAITLICRNRFLAHHPHYQRSAQRAHTEIRWEDVIQKVLQFLLKRK